MCLLILLNLYNSTMYILFNNYVYFVLYEVFKKYLTFETVSENNQIISHIVYSKKY